MFQVAADDVAGQILFAGIRFTLAGILVILFGSLTARRMLKPAPKDAGAILNLALWQTIIQYIFFYTGLAHAAAVRATILNGTQTFMTILLAVYIFHYEKLTLRKVIGCVTGFAGVVLIETLGQSVEFGFTWNGEGFVLISCFAASVSSCLIKKYSAEKNPVMLSGYQFLTGGLFLSAGAFAFGGRLMPVRPAAVLLILYMAFISSAAYTLWSLLLKYNPVSKVSVFTFVTPVAGVILSSVILRETSALNIYVIAALGLVCAGIMIVFWKGKSGEKKGGGRSTS